MYIPIIIDRVPFSEDIEMVRCIYFSVEGKPLFQTDQYNTLHYANVDAISKECELVEQRLGMQIEIEDFLIPLPAFETSDDGSLYRISEECFQKCLQLERGELSPNQFLKELPEQIHFCKEDTKAFRKFRRGRYL